mgnify:CR=1 FL=1
MKYRLLMIDDEELIRKGFLARLQYLNLEFEEILEASSGKEALLLLEKKSVDIVVTDIHMPDMDGLAFIAEAKPLYPHMKYIILSGYAEFAYAEQAISLGAKAYLLKPLSNEELKKVMEKTIQSLEKDERIRNTISSQTKLQKEKEQYTLEKGINELVSKQVMETEEKGFLYELLNGDHPRFFSPGCIHFLGIINIDGRSYSGSKFGHEDIDLIRFSIKNVFLEIVSVCDKVMVDNLSNYNQLYAIFSLEREKLLRNEIEQIFLKLQNIFEKKMDIFLTFGLSRGTLHLSAASKNEAMEALKQRLVYGTSNIYFYEDASIFQTEQFPTAALNMLYHYIERHDIGNIQTLIHEIFSEEKLIKYNVTYIRVMWVRILNMVLRNFNSKGIQNPKSMEKLLSSFSILDELHNVEEMEGYLIDIVMDCMQSEGAVDTNARNKIMLALQFIQENYNENIAINELAERYGMSPNYFSSVFKKVLKQSTVNYITEFRIKKAREFLVETNKSVIEIAKKVGYDDSQYFFRVFKKSTGLTPLQYRQQNR